MFSRFRYKLHVSAEIFIASSQVMTLRQAEVPSCLESLQQSAVAL